MTLITDFGWRDGYVGAMKGVILRLAPHSRIVDISHDVPPQDVEHAAWLCAETYPWYPPGTIHVVVVDPGVGTQRRILASRHGRTVCLAPDNGVLSRWWRHAPPEAMVTVTNRRYFLDPVNPTFHGRDLFAAVAGHLARGLSIARLGPPADSPVRLALPEPRWRGSQLQGVISAIDRFGNLISNIPARHWRLLHSAPRHRLWVGRRWVGTAVKTYAEIPGEEPAVLKGSSGCLEIACRNGSAQRRLQARRGQRIILRPASAG